MVFYNEVLCKNGTLLFEDGPAGCGDWFHDAKCEPGCLPVPGVDLAIPGHLQCPDCLAFGALEVQGNIELCHYCGRDVGA